MRQFWWEAIMMNILVTGSGGQLGQMLRSVSPASGVNFVFTDVSTGDGILPLDVLDSRAVSGFLSDYRIDAIVNCAGYTAVDRAENDRERCFEVNAAGPACLASAIRERGGLLIHISTDYVFGNDHAPVPLTENAPVSPLNVYGESKSAGEKEVVSSGCNYVILRTAWLYSAAGNNFFKTILSKSGTEPALSVVCDQVGSPTFALDLADVILTILNDYSKLITSSGNNLDDSHSDDSCGGLSDRLDGSSCGVGLSDGCVSECRGFRYAKSGIYHYSGEGVCSWFDFAKAICDFSGASCKVSPCRSTEFVTAAQRPAYSVLDKTRIKEVFGIEVPYWRDSLRRCFELMVNGGASE